MTQAVEVSWTTFFFVKSSKKLKNGSNYDHSGKSNLLSDNWAIKNVFNVCRVHQKNLFMYLLIE